MIAKMRNYGHLNILDHMAHNKKIDDLNENENLGTAISAYSSKRIYTNTEKKFKNPIRPQNNMHKNNSNRNKPGLTELSNDKTYLETDLPLRKRINEVELFNRKDIQKQCTLPVSDTTKEIKFINFVNNKKCFSEELNNTTNKLNSEETSKVEISSETDLNTLKKKLPQSPTRKCNSSLNNILETKLNCYSTEILNVNYEDKSLSDNDMKYTDEDSSNGKSNSEPLNTDKSNNTFDIEVKKCHELLCTYPPGDSINIETKIKNAIFNNEIKDSKFAVNSNISISRDTNHCLEILKMEKNNLEPKFSKSIDTQTVRSKIKFKVNSRYQKLHSFQNGVNNKDKIFEDQSSDKDVRKCKTFDSENINPVQPKFNIKDNSISSLLTSVSDKNNISCTKNEINYHNNKNEKDNTEFGEQNKCYITSDCPVNEDDLLAFSEFELSILADESMHENINGKENECDDDFEVSLLEDDTVIYDKNEILNKKETTDSYNELSVETKKRNDNFNVYIENDKKTTFVKDNDILSDQSTMMLKCNPNFESLTENNGEKDVIVNDALKHLIDQNMISTSVSIKKHKNLTYEKPVEDKKYPTIIENYVSLEFQNTNYTNECVKKFKSHTNEQNTKNCKKRVFNVKDCNIMEVKNMTSIPTNMQKVESSFETTDQITDITKLDKKENYLTQNKVRIKDPENIYEEISLNEKNELNEEHYLINSNEKTTFINKKYLNISSGNNNSLTDKNVTNNMDKIISVDENIISKEVAVDYVSFNKKMSSGSNEIIANNNIKELNSGNKSEERISSSFEKNVSEDTVHKGVQENEKSANGEEIKQNVDPIPDYYEDEKEDLIHPGWNKIKELSTDEERYRQVRDCWKSSSIPNPNKNLTYHSFRKKHLNKKEIVTRVIKQHKRQATSDLNNQNTKRSRLCTYTFDNHIHSKESEKKLKTEELKKEMNDKINNLYDIWYQQEIRLQSHLLYKKNKTVHTQNYYSELENIRKHYRQKISSVTNEYQRKITRYNTQYRSGIEALKKNRNEVFQFYSFYKGLQKEQKDPTILTNDQLQELNEIENIYQQLDDYYKCED